MASPAAINQPAHNTFGPIIRRSVHLERWWYLNSARRAYALRLFHHRKNLPPPAADQLAELRIQFMPLRVGHDFLNSSFQFHQAACLELKHQCVKIAH